MQAAATIVSEVIVPFSSARGLRLRYQLSGSGSTSLILIHELGGSLEGWSAVVASLDDGFRVLRYDLRGAGQSGPVRTPFTMEDQAADLEALLADSKLPPPFLIVGAAAGSAVAVTFAARHPAAVSGLILCPPALNVTADRRRYLSERSELAAREGMTAIVDQTLDKSFLQQSFAIQKGTGSIASAFCRAIQCLTDSPTAPWPSQPPIRWPHRSDARCFCWPGSTIRFARSNRSAPLPPSFPTHKSRSWIARTS